MRAHDDGLFCVPPLTLQASQVTWESHTVYDSSNVAGRLKCSSPSLPPAAAPSKSDLRVSCAGLLLPVTPSAAAVALRSAFDKSSDSRAEYMTGLTTSNAANFSASLVKVAENSSFRSGGVDTVGPRTRCAAASGLPRIVTGSNRTDAGAAWNSCGTASLLLVSSAPTVLLPLNWVAKSPGSLLQNGECRESRFFSIGDEDDTNQGIGRQTCAAAKAPRHQEPLAEERKTCRRLSHTTLAFAAELLHG